MSKNIAARNQHYVPQSYLREWLDDSKKLYAFNRRNGECITTIPRNVASLRDFHDTEKTKDPSRPDTFQSVEKWFQKREEEAKVYFDQVRQEALAVCNRHIEVPATCEYKFQEDLIFELCKCTAIQMMRIEHFRDGLRFSWNALMNHVFYEITPLLFPDADLADGSWFTGMHEDALKEFHIAFLKTRMEKFAKVLQSKVIVVGANKTGMTLVSSDNPVLRLGTVVDWGLPWDGLASPAVQIFYPLSPDVALIFSDPNYQKYNIPSDRRIRPLRRDEVQANNRHQLFQSNRFIFANRKELAFAQNEFLKDSYTRVPEHHSRLNEFGDLIAELRMFALMTGPGVFQKDQWKRILTHEQLPQANRN